MKNWILLVKVDGGNQYVNHSGWAMLRAQVSRPVVIRERERIAA